MIKTCLCIFQKFNKNDNPKNTDNILLCEVENLGYEATGKSKSGSEVENAIAAFYENGGWS